MTLASDILCVSYQPGVLAMQGPMDDLSTHRHHALQVIPEPQSGDLIEVNGEPVRHRQPLVILPDIPHRYCSADGCVLLINAESHLAQDLKARASATQGPSGDKGANIASEFVLPGPPEPFREFATLIRQFVQYYAPDSCLQVHADSAFENLFSQVQVRAISGEMAGVDLHWAASQVHLSESRFMHRFKEFSGIPWRPFLLWFRLLSAALQMRTGKELTDVALAAGFSDSAHFSRTFKANFGIAPSRVLKNSRFIQSARVTSG